MEPQRRRADRQPWIVKYWPIITAVIGGAMYMGALAQRVSSLEEHQRYEHGTYQVPQGAK